MKNKRKIKIYKYNVKVNIDDDIKKIKEYFLSSFVRKFIYDGIDISFDVETTNIPKDESLSLFNQKTDYDYIVYMADSSSIYSAYFGWTFKLEDKIGIYLKCDSIHDNIDYTWKSLAHEIMHAERLRLEIILKRPLPDPMDEFRRNGKVYSYYKNDDPYAEDGNFSEALRVLGIFLNNKVILKREKSSKNQTLGFIQLENNKFHTLELPDLNNLPNISCIPKGRYKVKWTFSPRFMKYTYEIQDVPGRSGIRIHVANHYYQLNGCIALGKGLLDINKDGTIDVTESKKAIQEFEDLMGRKEFILEIV